VTHIDIQKFSSATKGTLSNSCNIVSVVIQL